MILCSYNEMASIRTQDKKQIQQLLELLQE